jgi:hypothetical protein
MTSKQSAVTAAVSIVAAVLVFLFFVPGPAFEGGEANNKGRNDDKNMSTQKSAQFAWLASQDVFSGLPVAEISTHPVESSQGLAIFIPQNHKYPGSKLEDPRNDSVEKTQREIYRILTSLNKNFGIGLIVNEGELAGKVAPEKGKTAYVRKLLEVRESLLSGWQIIRSLAREGKLNQAEYDQVSDELEKVLSAINREAALTGAPYILQTYLDGVEVYGSENQETREKCQEIVRDYIYQYDALVNAASPGARAKRNDIAVLNPSWPEKNPQSGKDPDSLSVQAMLEIGDTASDSKTMSSRLLDQRPSVASKLTRDLEEIGAEYEQNGEKRPAQAVKRLLEFLAELEGILASSGQTTDSERPAGSFPPRAGNPYWHIRDMEKIQQMIKEAEKDINNYVIELRNEEAAANFAAALKQAGEKAGIIQFGAGHEDGLIKALNHRSITVIMIKPTEVKKREADNLTLFR